MAHGPRKAASTKTFKAGVTATSGSPSHWEIVLLMTGILAEEEAKQPAPP